MATKFTDDNGKEWTLSILLGAVKRIKELHGVDILADWESDQERTGLLLRLRNDPVLFGDVLAETIVGGATEELFDGLKGDGLRRAYKAFWEDLVPFFPEPEKRQALAMAVEKAEEVATLGWKSIKESLSKTSATTLLKKAEKTPRNASAP